jgi:hypothetical protein
MAYLTPIRMYECSYGCGKKATVELKTFRNEHYGWYCDAHGKTVLAMVKKDEGRADGTN